MSVKYVSNSKNRKIGDNCDATYLPLKSCPTCPLKNSGCYAQNSYVGMIVSKLNKKSNNLSPLQIARNEAIAIDSSYNGGNVPQKYLRLHVSGDCKSKKGVRLINSSIGRWKNRGGKLAWSYTRAWRNIPRSLWNNVSILASIDNIKEAPLARKAGYVPSLIVKSHKSSKAFFLKGSKIKWIPCPAQTKNISCVQCKLCMIVDKLYKRNLGIAFEAHGIKRKYLLNIIR